MIKSPYQQAYEAGIKLAHSNSGLTKEALLSYLKPINKGLKGDALIDRIAPLGWRRIGGDIGHNLSDAVMGGGIGALASGTEAGALAGAMAGGGFSRLMNQYRANRYLDLALNSGPNRLSKRQLKKLVGEMGGFDNFVGASSVTELLGGIQARKRVEEHIKNRII